MTRFAFLVIALACFLPVGFACAQPVPAAIFTDPPADSAHPARMEVIHVPTGGVEINGVVYVAAGPGPHPTFVFFHGLPGNEKSLDLVHAVRRAGWNAVSVNYRGSWGSGGTFAFAHNPEDARAVLAYLRDPVHAASLSVDPGRLVICGHSMGGWVVAQTAAAEKGLLGAIMISAWDIGSFSDPKARSRAEMIAFMADNHETLAGATPEAMADDALAHRKEWEFPPLGPKLAGTRLLLLSSNDGFTPYADALEASIRAAGGTRVTHILTATDHVWSDRRVALASQVIQWLNNLPSTP